ncbi:MAG: hypothetical protein ACUBOA_04275 [Candidatus Loosdrechtia sp.]|uniref:hypothetical protein n=1 Tax=Candidatus Loosdrechtia sp. TaxID=3101272 RepID=UPI003A75DC9A|nr:MAG: hypothetical protein QY305_00155 [Candidatus Jettenia sp. AMX2]
MFKDAIMYAITKDLDYLQNIEKQAKVNDLGKTLSTMGYYTYGLQTLQPHTRGDRDCGGEGMINMIEPIGAMLTSAIRNLFDQQPDVLRNTSRMGMTEWNLGHHLANEIAKYIFWLNHDMDVMKRNYNNRRPDIIFHKRGSNDLNYLVIEIKCNNSTSGDIKRIKRDWMGDELHYRFGATIVVNSDNDFKMTVFYKNSSKEYLPSSQTLALPQIIEKQPFIALVDQILAAKRTNPAADTSELEKQIDQLVYKLYGLTGDEIKIVENSNS